MVRPSAGTGLMSRTAGSPPRAAAIAVTTGPDVSLSISCVTERETVRTAQTSRAVVRSLFHLVEVLNDWLNCCYFIQRVIDKDHLPSEL